MLTRKKKINVTRLLDSYKDRDYVAKQPTSNKNSPVARQPSKVKQKVNVTSSDCDKGTFDPLKTCVANINQPSTSGTVTHDADTDCSGIKSKVETESVAKIGDKTEKITKIGDKTEKTSTTGAERFVKPDSENDGLSVAKFQRSLDEEMSPSLQKMVGETGEATAGTAGVPKSENVNNQQIPGHKRTQVEERIKIQSKRKRLQAEDAAAAEYGKRFKTDGSGVDDNGGNITNVNAREDETSLDKAGSIPGLKHGETVDEVVTINPRASLFRQPVISKKDNRKTKDRSNKKSKYAKNSLENQDETSKETKGDVESLHLVISSVVSLNETWTPDDAIKKVVSEFEANVDSKTEGATGNVTKKAKRPRTKQKQKNNEATKGSASDAKDTTKGLTYGSKREVELEAGEMLIEVKQEVLDQENDKMTEVNRTVLSETGGGEGSSVNNLQMNDWIKEESQEGVDDSLVRSTERGGYNCENDTNDKQMDEEEDGNKTVRDDKVLYSCWKCNETFTTLAKYKDHRREEKNCMVFQSLQKEQQKKEEGDYFPCMMCNKAFTRRDAFTAHIGWHKRAYLKDYNKYYCGACCIYCPNYTGLRTHLLNHFDRSKGKNCNFCPLSFSTPQHLKKHMDLHTYGEERSPFKCPLCEFICWFVYAMKYHFQTAHPKEKMLKDFTSVGLGFEGMRKEKEDRNLQFEKDLYTTPYASAKMDDNLEDIEDNEHAIESEQLSVDVAELEQEREYERIFEKPSNERSCSNFSLKKAEQLAKTFKINLFKNSERPMKKNATQIKRNSMLMKYLMNKREKLVARRADIIKELGRRQIGTGGRFLIVEDCSILDLYIKTLPQKQHLAGSDEDTARKKTACESNEVMVDSESREKKKAEVDAESCGKKKAKVDAESSGKKKAETDAESCGKKKADTEAGSDKDRENGKEKRNMSDGGKTLQDGHESTGATDKDKEKKNNFVLVRDETPFWSLSYTETMEMMKTLESSLENHESVNSPFANKLLKQ